MDPISIIGTAGVILNVICALGKTINAVSELRSQWSNAEMTLATFETQLIALKAALVKIEEWAEANFEDSYHQLVIDLSRCVSHCTLLIDKIDAGLATLRTAEDGRLDVPSKLRLLFKTRDMGDVQKMVKHLTSALTLLLTACNCQSLSQQKDFLEGRGTRRTLEKLDDSASLMVHRDVDSLQTFFSGTSITSSKRSVVFDFDRELFSSRIYERWIRGSVREHLQKQQNHFLASTSANRLGVPLLRGFMGPVPKPQLRPQEHVYEPLKGSRNIRLLVLFAGAGDNPLQGELTEVVLNEPREYVALSYNWDRIEMQPSQRYLQTPMGIFGLPESLHSALHCLRDPFQHRMIWVAAICVPHDNRMERETLVSLLGEIFRRAQRVVAWVGDATASSDRAVEVLRQIHSLSLEPSKPLNGPSKLPVPTWRESGYPDMEDSIWEDIESFFQRPWFSRAWVIQDVVFASSLTVCCGSTSLEWEELFKAFQICVRARPRLVGDRDGSTENCECAIAAYTLGVLREAYRTTPPGIQYSLLQLLDICWYSSSSPLDKLYSLLHLASDGEQAALQPNYTQPLEAVIFRYAASFVDRGDALYLLYRAGTGKSFAFHSWIPNWTQRKRIRTISTWPRTRDVFCASDHTITQHRTNIMPNIDKAQPNIRKFRGRLNVCGLRIDRIIKVENILFQPREDAKAYVGALWDAVNSLPSYPTGESLDEVKRRFPIGDATARVYLDPLPDFISHGAHIPPPPRPEEDDMRENTGSCVDYFETISPRMAPQDDFDGQTRHEAAEDPASLTVWDDYYATASAFSAHLSGAWLCVTEKGYVGLVPPNTAIGDSIVLIRGAVVPFILRDSKDKESQSFNTLVGECYVHGIMHGEAWSWDSDDTKDEVFALR